jgi:hypothetical protein
MLIIYWYDRHPFRDWSGGKQRKNTSPADFTDKIINI